MTEKPKKICLFIFIDALGWNILKEHPHFLKGLAVGRKKLRTILGYSSACDPSIISGLKPSQHLHWSSFYYSPQTSPFKWVRHLKWLPTWLTGYHRIRHRLSHLIARVHKFTGYFQVYQVPFEYLSYFDYAEKKWMWGEKKGLIQGNSIFDYLIQHRIPFYVKESFHVSDEEQWKKATALIKNQEIAYAYLSFGKLDALMHAKGTHHPSVGELLKDYDRQIREIVEEAKKSYEEVSWYVFSDHGMHNIHTTFDLKQAIEGLGLVYGKDYAAMYDSTMGRFWFLNDHARQAIKECLSKIKAGKIMTDEELKEMGVFFPDRRYGETIFLLNPGIIIAPSFMNTKLVPGMHGFHPDDADSDAMICSHRLLPPDLTSIEQIFWLMIQDLKK